MSDAPSPLRSNARRLLAALLMFGAVAEIAPAQAATWKLEPIGSSDGVAELQDFGFDAQGRGLLSWSGLPPGLATRDPSGGWQRPRDGGAVQPATTQIHVGRTSTLLVAREARTEANLRRLVFADGRSDGSFGTLTPLDDFVGAHWSAANAGGDAIVAWRGERTPFLRVAERAAGQSFAAARDLAVGQTGAVAINDRGDRVLAWRAGRRLAARLRRAGGEWGDTERFGRITSIQSLRLNALMVRNGRVVLTWGNAGRPCGVSVRTGSGRWSTRTLERRCGPTSDSRAAPVLALADGRGATYVAWTGRTRTGRRAVKFARVGGGGAVRPIVLSRERSAVLDDVAAGPGRALAVTYAAPRPTRANPLLSSTFVALRRGGGAFQHDRLTPPGFAARRGSRVAFQPLTGEPVVAVPFLIGLKVAVSAAVGPAAP
ncbi:MAG TPA: hypothetical protein VNA28_12960 [Solirubrobacteraceae bacterium]|nr:hypothetical protein [Solirubrobacteraceae bacterium]